MTVNLDLRNLTALERRHRAVTKRAINRAARPVRAAVVAQAENIKRFGFLAKSIRQKSKVYSKDSHVLVVGPSMRYERKKGKISRGPRKGQPRIYAPWRYSNVITSPKSNKYRPWLKNAFHATSERYLQPVAKPG